jgi:preprotein translocase subunit YajC
LAQFLAGTVFDVNTLYAGNTVASAALLAQEAGGAGGGGGFESLFGSMAIPLMITFLLMYLLLMRPEQKKRKEMEARVAAVKKNDHVVTIGGIYGTVVAAQTDSKFVTLRVDDSTGTKLKVLRSAISHVGVADEADGDVKPGE